MGSKWDQDVGPVVHECFEFLLHCLLPVGGVGRGECVLVAVWCLGGFAGDGGELLKTHVGCVFLL